jgi:tyrosyl-tRNA synthetase
VDDLKAAQAASEILFGKSTEEDLRSISEGDLLDVFEGVPQGSISRSELEVGMGIVDLLVKPGFLPSNSEARRALQENSISINKVKVTADSRFDTTQLLRDKYLLLQRGKKNYFLLKAE